MSRWDIDPAASARCCTSTEGVAQEFDGQMTTLNASIEGAMGQSSSDIVGQALAGYAESATRTSPSSSPAPAPA